MYLFQSVDAVKDLLNISDITVFGVLVGIIFLLLFAVRTLWNKIDSLNAYIRDQNKENLEVLNALANSLGGVEGKVDNNILLTTSVKDRLDDIRVDIKTKLNDK